MERAAGAIAFGAVATVIACAAILGVDADGDRLAVELQLVIAVAAALGLAILSRSAPVLAIALGVGGAAWLGWSAHVITLQAGLACVALFGIGVTSAAVAPGLLRSLREYV